MSGGARLVHDLAVAHHGDRLADGEDLLEAMRDEQHGGAALGQRADDAEQPLDLGADSAAVGSSMISTRASKLSALAISTICWSAIESPRTGRSASRRTPRRSSRLLDLLSHGAAVDPPAGPQRMAAHHTFSATERSPNSVGSW